MYLAFLKRSAPKKIMNGVLTLISNNMDLLHRAADFENRKWSGMTTSDRINASREAKELILSINEVYKTTKDESLMDVMKRLTAIKRKIEKRLNAKL